MTPLPAGLRVVLDPSVRRRSGDLLVGGAPRRALRLSPAGWRALEQLQADGPATAGARALGRRLVDAGLAHPRPAPRPVDDVAVVVPVRDRAEELDRCLRAVGEAVRSVAVDGAGAAAPATSTPAGTSVPVIVVDDGSRDPAAVAAVAARHGAAVVRRPVAGGPAAARNAALPHVHARVVAFVDSDCRVGAGWLRTLLGHFDDPLVGAVAPRIRSRARAGGVLARYLAARSPLDLGPGEAPVEAGGAVSYVPTAALLVRREALGDGFDAALRYGEDVDLVWRLREAGWRVRYDPAVEVDHDEPGTPRAVAMRRFTYGTSAAALARRHPGRLAPAVLRPWPTLTAALLAAGRVEAAAVLATQQATLLGDRLHRTGLPRRAAVPLVAGALWHAALSAGRYAAMLGAPAVPAAAARGRRGGVLAALVVLPALEEWRRRRPALDPVRFTALALADDAVYGLGVWCGCLRHRSAAPLLPNPGVIREPGRPDRR